MGKFSYKEKNYSRTSSEAISIAMFFHTWTWPHAFNWGWDSPWWQFWNSCSPEEKFCSWYNSEHVYLYWLQNHNSEQQHYLFSRAWYHRPTRREPPPFPLKWCLLFLPSLSFLLFAYGYSIFSIFFFVHFLDCCMSHTYGLKSCCRTEAILSDCEDVSVGHICTTDHLNHVPLNKSLYAYLGIRRKFDWNLTSWTGIIEQHALVHNFLYILNVN